MPAKKSAARRKRAPSAPKKQQSVAAKKKHVRELAKAGRWAEIEKLYGKKIVAKAKTYTGKQRVPKTPQEIAREILLKNGYLPSVAQAEDRSSGQPEVLEPAARGGNSPDALTEAQQELIEKRRQDALKRRRRAQQVARPNVVPPDRVEAAVLPRGRPPVAPDAERHRPPPRQARTAPGRSVYCTPHRVVTPENLPATNPVVEAEQVRPEYFWDDLEAAAEIVQWEKEHMAEVAIEQPPKPQRDCRASSGVVGQQRQPQPAVSRASSLSQELAAAAEIIQWEKEHEAPACSRQGGSSGSDTELDAPQFQLMPVHFTEEPELHERNGPDARAPTAATRTAQPVKAQSRPPRKRPLEAMAPPALPCSSAASNGHPQAGAHHHSTPSRSPQGQRNPTADFLDKHLLDGHLELPVLEFLDMMLA